MAERAQKEKEQGNTAFKAGDFPGAIGHYTAAILADRNDPTYPLNRAAAYLKLGKYEDAERDCNTVLGLSAKNVKAYFRRGQAKVGLEKLFEAQRDFTEALRLEPDNQATKEELRKVAELIEIEKRKKPGHRHIDVTFGSTLHPTSAPKRRRVPITIVEPPGSPQKDLVAEVERSKHMPGAPKSVKESPKPIPTPANGDVQESSSSPLKTSPASLKPESKSRSPPSQQSPSVQTSPTPSTPVSPSPSTPSAALKATSFADAKKVRETKTSKVGGGIFRASGQNTIFPTRTGSPSGSRSPPASSPSQKEAPTVKSQNEAKPISTKEISSPSSNSQLTPETTLNPEPEPRPSPAAPPSVPRSVSAPASDKTVGSPVDNAVLHQPPATLFDFNRAWRSMLTSAERWKLLQTIPPSSIPSFCKSSLEPTLLVSILEVFLVVLSSQPTADNKTHIREYMDNLAKVSRFPTLILFLSGTEKAIAKEVWRKLGVQGNVPGPWSALGSLSA